MHDRPPSSLLGNADTSTPSRVDRRVADGAGVRSLPNQHAPAPLAPVDGAAERYTAADDPMVRVVLCVYRPDVRLLRRQIDSVLRQDYGKLELLVVPDGPWPQAKRILAEFDDPRIVLVPERSKVGVYLNFARGLRHALARSESSGDLFAFCDQDDIWHPKKLARHVDFLHGRPLCSLSHSDARIVDARGDVIHASMFAYERRNRDSRLSRLILVNNVTGMTAVFRRHVARLAATAPPQAGLLFHHDLWTALIAGAIGEIGFIDEPLVDYVQHDANVVGAVAAVSARRTRKRGFMSRAYVDMCARQYLVRYFLFRRLKAAVGDRKGSPRPRSFRLSRKLFGAGIFGFEGLAYAGGLLLSGQPGLARQAFRVALGKLAILRETLSAPGHPSVVQRFRDVSNQKCREVIGYTASPELAVDDDWESYCDGRMQPIDDLRYEAGPKAVNLLVPSLNPDHAYAGIATAIDFASLFVGHGFHVRFIATDLPIRDKVVSKNFILERVGGETREKLAKHCTVVDFRNEPARVVGRDDVWIATAWWTAYVAQAAVADPRSRTRGFIYMIQDFEPGFYPWSAAYANALASYQFDFVPVFNTTFLREHFLRNRIIEDARECFCFSPSLQLEKYAPDPQRLKRAGRRKRVIFYGRPSVARNMFELGVTALARWCEENDLDESSLEIVSVGEQHADITLPNGLTIRSLGKLPWEDYPSFLQTGDIGLSLMLSPHPSHIPLEMAASGMLCVTNRYDIKDLSTISQNIISVGSTLDEVVAGLSMAFAGSKNVDKRISNSVFSVSLGDPLEALPERILAQLPSQRASGGANRTPAPVGYYASERLVSPAGDGKPRVFFMHIAKTAGSYVNAMIAAAYEPDAVDVHIERYPMRQNVQRISGRSFVSGHVYLNNWKRIDPHDEFLRVTVLRNPYNQLASHILWLDHYNLPEFADECRRLDPETRQLVSWIGGLDLSDLGQLDDLLTKLPAKGIQYFDNCQSRYFIAGHEDGPAIDEPISLKHRPLLARMAGELDFIGLAEHMQDAVRVLSSSLGLKLDYQEEIANPARSARSINVSSPEVRDILRKRIMLDLWIYEAARRGVIA